MKKFDIIPTANSNTNNIRNNLKLSNKQLKQIKLKEAVSRSFNGKVRDEILKENREFICEGNLTKIDRFSRKQVYRFFLFSDFLYYADSSEEKTVESGDKRRKSFLNADDIDTRTSHIDVVQEIGSPVQEIGSPAAFVLHKIHQKLNLSSLQILSKSQSQDDVENRSFVIGHPIKSFTVIAGTLDIKNNWVVALDATKEKLRLRTEGSDNEDEDDGDTITTKRVSGASAGAHVGDSKISAAATSPSPIAAVHPHRYEGNFKKQGHINIFSWKQRHFILDDGRLQYFDEHSNMMGEISDLAGFEVNIVSINTLTILASGKKGLTLIIEDTDFPSVSVGGGGVAQSGGELAQQNKLILYWKRHIQEHIDYCNNKLKNAI